NSIFKENVTRKRCLMEKKCILITGGSGLVGSRLSVLLKEKGHEVRHLSRSPKSNAVFPSFKWNINEQYIDSEALKGVDVIIHLAGAGIADKRWTDARKQLIISSRVESTRLLYRTIDKLENPPESFLAAAAVGLYGDRGDEQLTEESEPGSGFLAESCIAWENALDELDHPKVRLVKLRIGIVMSTQGGALEKMLLSFHARLGTYFGKGKQFYPWIHIEDLSRMFIWAIENPEIAGTFNAVAPEPQRNKALTEKIAKALDKPSLIVPAPEFGLRLAMGEMADVVMVSANVSNEKIAKAGFKYQHPELVSALKDLLKRKI
ncbi:MAG: TIGR01777 family oxidoreductase, partial [Bacteroidota bacterium]